MIKRIYNFFYYFLTPCNVWSYEFQNDQVAHQFLNSPRKICAVVPHDVPFIDGIVVRRSFVSFGEPEAIIYSQGLGPLSCFFPWCQEIPIGGGFVARETEKLDKTTKFTRAIFIQGGGTEWKSGAFHLRRQLGCPMFFIFLDYETRRVTIYG
jgi:hypothetical protein